LVLQMPFICGGLRTKRQHEKQLTSSSRFYQVATVNVRAVWRYSSLPSLVFRVRHQAPAPAGAFLFLVESAITERSAEQAVFVGVFCIHICSLNNI